MADRLKESAEVQFRFSESKRLPGTSEADKLPVNLSTSVRVSANYIQALGGAAAIEQTTSRVEKGTAS